MPNWCKTEYSLRGPEKDLKEIEKILNVMENNEPKVKNGFGRMWLGEFVEWLGESWENIPCRGEIISFDRNDYGDLRIEQETAWSEQIFIRKLIEKKYPDVKVFVLEEEEGMGIYRTNDVNRECYKMEYKLETCSDGDYNTEYYGSIDSVAEELKQYGFVPNSEDLEYDISKFVDTYNDIHDNDEEENSIYFSKLQVVSY